MNMGGAGTPACARADPSTSLRAGKSVCPTNPKAMARRERRGKHNGSARPQLYPYQRRWVEDESRFKIACKARQVGFTFAAAWRVVDRRLDIPGTTLWLSASERQALEAMEHVRRFAKELGVVGIHEEDFIEGTLLKQHAVRFPNGSRIVALPANPDTVRGFAGDVVLDEFAFHRDAEAIWRAAFATATRGFQLEIISTPNGARGRYYDLAKAAGLVDYRPAQCTGGQTFVSGRGQAGMPVPLSLSSPVSPATVFSPHWVDLASARTQGFVVDVESLRAAIADEDAWQQEYCCRFLADAAHYLPPELVVAAEHPRAATTLSLTSHESPVASHCYLGVDIGRRRDLTVLWLLEADDAPAPVYWTRGILALDRQPFAAQRQALDELLALRGENLKSQISDLRSFAVKRCALDATGLGAMLAEELQTKWGARVEPVVFTQAVKENLAVRVKRLLEEGRVRLPADPAVRAALGSVKRYITPSGNIRFDADRTEAAGHADHFWALALALGAAEEPDISLEFVSSTRLRSFAQAYHY